MTVREVSLLLGISEKDVMELAETGGIPAYKIGGVYLRFKKDQVNEYLKSNKNSFPKSARPPDYPFRDRIADFFYFNDFYIFAALIISLFLILIFRGY